MIVAGSGMRVVVATRPVDFRKGHDALAALVEHELGLDPYSGVGVPVPASRSGQGAVVGRDGSGARIEASGARAVCLALGARRADRVSRGQFEALFEGLDWRRVWVPRVRRPRAAAGVPGRPFLY